MIRSSLLVLAGVLSLGAHASEPLRGDEGIGYYVGVDSAGDHRVRARLPDWRTRTTGA
jgi:hypothetical protein